MQLFLLELPNQCWQHRRNVGRDKCNLDVNKHRLHKSRPKQLRKFTTTHWTTPLAQAGRHNQAWLFLPSRTCVPSSSSIKTLVLIRPASHSPSWSPVFYRSRLHLLLLQQSTAMQVRSSVRLMPQNQPSGRGLLPSPTTWSSDQHLAAMLADASLYILGRTEGRGQGFGQLVRTHTRKWLKCQSSSDGHSDHSAKTDTQQLYP